VSTCPLLGFAEEGDNRVVESLPIRSPSPDELREWTAEFEAAARRPLATRLRYAFIRTYKPVLDDASFRSFDTMAEYRDWCARNLPGWLCYGPAV
jgi:hypothetical protein